MQEHGIAIFLDHWFNIKIIKKMLLMTNEIVQNKFIKLQQSSPLPNHYQLGK